MLLHAPACMHFPHHQTSSWWVDGWSPGRSPPSSGLGHHSAHIWRADTLPPLNLLSSLENKWFGLLGDSCTRGQGRPWSCCCCGCCWSPLQLSWRSFSASWYLLHNLGSVLGAFANHLATSVGSRYHLMLPLVVKVQNKTLNSGCLDDRLSFPPVVRPICTPAGEIDSESLLLPKWTGWDPGSVTDDALSVFHPVLSRQRHTSARSRSSSASIFAPRIIPDAVENSHLLTRCRETDAPVELSCAVDSASTPSPPPQIQQSPRELRTREKPGTVWKRPLNRRLKTTVSVILSLLRRTHCSRLFDLNRQNQRQI